MRKNFTEGYFSIRIPVFFLSVLYFLEKCWRKPLLLPVPQITTCKMRIIKSIVNAFEILLFWIFEWFGSEKVFKKCLVLHVGSH